VTLLILEVTVSDEGGTWINHHNMLQVVHRMDHTVLAAIWFPLVSLAVFGALAVFYLLPSAPERRQRTSQPFCNSSTKLPSGSSTMATRMPGRTVTMGVDTV